MANSPFTNVPFAPAIPGQACETDHAPGEPCLLDIVAHFANKPLAERPFFTVDEFKQHLKAYRILKYNTKRARNIRKGKGF